MVDGSDGGVSDNSYIVRSAVGNSAGNVCSGSDLSDGVRLGLSLSLPPVHEGISSRVSVDHGGHSVHCSVGESGYLTETVTVGNSSDNTTSSLPSQDQSNGVWIRLARDGYSQEHCDEGTHGECLSEWTALPM